MNTDRFKFRVWDKTENKYNGFSFHLAMSGELDRLSVDGDLLATDEDRLIVEQCTGLKDREGKLVFEGDVLRFASQIDVCVTFRNGGFVYCLTGDEKLAYRFTEVIAKETQIIGNIHENSEVSNEE